jgi:hypothetical protein
VVATGAIATAFSIVPQFDDARKWMVESWRGIGSVELPGAYPGEIWKPASAEQVTWLQDEWCYPSLRGFKSRFRLQNGTLFRQNEATPPAPFVSEWVAAEVYVSNKKVLRLRYKLKDWPGDYIDFDPEKSAEWRENQRFTEDDGTVVAGKKRLVLSCSRCALSRDGITYSCS